MQSEPGAFFDRVRPEIDQCLDRLLPPAASTPTQLHQAIRHSIFAGGKRLRPALCIAGFAAIHAEWTPVVPVACAIEMIHTYSLIHDDLPAMDDDDFRRGVPSCHKQFGEAIAILAGDALLTMALETLGNCDAFEPARMLKVLSMLAVAAGTPRGMIAGQVLDLEAEQKPIREVNVEEIHRCKTGALMATSVAIGAYLGGAAAADYAAVTRFGERIGLAFQVVDDILDETASSEALGKTSGKDRERQKATYPALYGLEKSRQIVESVTAQARSAVEPLGSKAATLIAIADYLEKRSH